MIALDQGSFNRWNSKYLVTLCRVGHVIHKARETGNYGETEITSQLH